MTDWETPLAERMRPESLDEYVGQKVLAQGSPLRACLEKGVVPSCVLYGPPGVGKTALVRLMAKVTNRDLFEINAVSSKVSDLRELIDRASDLKAMSGRAVLAFVDELYHFNKSQQDVLLPSVEKGGIILIGTTTENPYFTINKTLLSRLLVIRMDPLEKEDLVAIMERALKDGKKGLGELGLKWEREALCVLAESSNGDGRQALTRLEYLSRSLCASGGNVITAKLCERALPGAFVRHDRSGDDHYQVVSAFIKSIRGSDPDAALYWLSRLLESGEDQRFLARRMVISASEDIGLADPMALVVANSAASASEMTGDPESKIILAEAALYLACAPKSNASYEALKRAISAIEKGDIQKVPDHLINGNPGYLYPHDYKGHWVAQAYLEKPRRFYFPTEIGCEAKISERMSRLWRRFKDPKAKGQ